jgi:hypothetical protein
MGFSPGKTGGSIMSLGEVVVGGTLKPDGTVELDEKPSLAPGRVTIVLRQESAADRPQQSWFQLMQSARKQMQDAGCHFMDEKGVQAHVEWLREGDRVDDLMR